MHKKLKFLKKSAILCMAFVMCVSLFSGCGKDVSDSDAGRESLLPEESIGFFPETEGPLSTAVPSETPKDSSPVSGTSTMMPETPLSTPGNSSGPTVSPENTATESPDVTNTLIPTATAGPEITVSPVATKSPEPTQPPVNGPSYIMPVSPSFSGVNIADYAHISFDDVHVCFENLAKNSYKSLWDEPFFRWLKVLHDTYGVKFSLYTYNDVLAKVNGRYAGYFDLSKDWLKIGFHSAVKYQILSGRTYDDGKLYWNEFVRHVTRITGSYAPVDRIPRLEGYVGSLEMLKGMRDAKYGALGFLSADDSRLSYYFDSEIAQYLYNHDYTFDSTNNMIFISTDFRAEWYENGYTNKHSYKKPTESSVYNELEKRQTSADFAGSWNSIIFFSHEYLIYNGDTIRNNGASFVEYMCKFISQYDIDTDYPQNRIDKMMK